ncbi:MAG: HAMP domain-containing sensor histidine kinase [Myxococcota bacterium]|nr:HAMP domain-containing sensor histidine kinase [Myxococcota bacterium]
MPRDRDLERAERRLRRAARKTGHHGLRGDDLEGEIRERLAEKIEELESRGKRRRRGKLTPEERAYREARQAVAARIGFLAHFVPYATTCLFLLLVGGFRVAMIVALAWGIGVACHGFYSLVAPGLRRRWIEDEVRARVHIDVSRNRREIEGRHARTLEHLSASLAHEIRNPITAAKSLVQQMGEDPASTENVEYADVALQELERVERSISHLLRYARDEEMQVHEVRIPEVVDSALETLRDRIDRSPAALHRDVEEAGAVAGDPEKLRRIVINLIANALDAVADVAKPRVEVQAGENLAGSEAWIRVRDNGPGIDPERLDKIWTPFHTSKSNGTGLGLAITRKIVEAHGGSIEVESAPGQGTEFVVTLPKNGIEEARS